MRQQEPAIVKQAVQHFNKGEFLLARRCYQQAAAKYNHALFELGIKLCDSRLAADSFDFALNENQQSAGAQPGTDVERQLQQTQALLEHYYARCKELEYQLMDRR